MEDMYECGCVSEDIERNILAFASRLQLSYGAFDFIETRNCEMFFLECNPAGQWLWIEEKIGMPISEAVAEFLVDS